MSNSFNKVYIHDIFASQQTLYTSLAIPRFEAKAVLGTLIYKYIPWLHANTVN